MNAILKCMAAHRSIRRYRPEPINDQAVKQVVQTAQQAATSGNVQAYCVIRVRGQAVRDVLIELTGGQEKVARCAAFFIFCGDQRRHRLMARRADQPFDTRLEAFLIAVIDATLFAQNVALGFESLGYGTCFIGGLRNRLPDVDRLLQLPEGVLPLFGLCVGVPDEDPAKKPRLPLEAVLFDERYPDDATMLAHIDAYDRACRAYSVRHRGETRDWSSVMEGRFAEPKRTDLADYYRSKGADLS